MVQYSQTAAAAINQNGSCPCKSTNTTAATTPSNTTVVNNSKIPFWGYILIAILIAILLMFLIKKDKDK